MKVVKCKAETKCIKFVQQGGLILPLHQSGENKDENIQHSIIICLWLVIFNHLPLLLTTILILDQSNLNSKSCVGYDKYKLS